MTQKDKGQREKEKKRENCAPCGCLWCPAENIKNTKTLFKYTNTPSVISPDVQIQAQSTTKIQINNSRQTSQQHYICLNSLKNNSLLIIQVSLAKALAVYRRRTDLMKRAMGPDEP